MNIQRPLHPAARWLGSILALLGSTALLSGAPEKPAKSVEPALKQAQIKGFLVVQLADGSFAGAASLPKDETPVHLFNGKSLEGWDGDSKYWSVVDGEIVGANSGKVPSSSYLFTKKSYRSFRLLFEVKQTMSPKHSTMHSAVAALGKRFEDKGENKHGFKGPLLMFCHDWGIWDAYGRNRVVHPVKTFKEEKKGEWNRIEMLVVGNRIRVVANGLLVFDFTDKPELLHSSPLGLQLHSNGKPQEFRFRGLILTENPADQLITLP